MCLIAHQRIKLLKSAIMKKNVNIEVDCAVCAQKCEDAIKKVDGVNSCAINFITQKMMIDVDDNNTDAIIKKVKKVKKKSINASIYRFFLV